MKLILFTNSYPFGMGELWKHNELKLLSEHFDEIKVIPYHYDGNSVPKPKPNKKIEFCNPLFYSNPTIIKKAELVWIFFNRNFFRYMKELIRLLKNPSKYKLIRYLTSIKRSQLLLDLPDIKKILTQDNNNVVLYFYWGLGTSEIVPFINVSKFKKVIIRMHRYDLYEYENQNYIPFRKQLLNKKITVLPSSDDGFNNLKFLYPNAKAEIKTQRCGVIKANKSLIGNKQEVLRIVSCSLLSPVKRIDIMIEAASKLNIPFEWYHVGYGKLKNELEQKIIEKKLKGKFILVGKIESELILDYYLEKNFDVFVNTSKSEGVPFSIMEAFSVGIPVIASDAGGTKEIVDETVGSLLRNDLNYYELTTALESFYNLSDSDREIIGKNALNRFKTKCDMEKLTKEFIEIIKT